MHAIAYLADRLVHDPRFPVACVCSLFLSLAFSLLFYLAFEGALAHRAWAFLGLEGNIIWLNWRIFCSLMLEVT